MMIIAGDGSDVIMAWLLIASYRNAAPFTIFGISIDIFASTIGTTPYLPRQEIISSRYRRLASSGDYLRPLEANAP